VELYSYAVVDNDVCECGWVGCDVDVGTLINIEIENNV
jgi:hypothetical protein